MTSNFLGSHVYNSPLKLLKFLIGTRCENYSRERAARACQCDPATITRALAVLEHSGAIQRQRGGRSTSAKVTVFMGIETFLRRYTKMRRYEGKNAPLSAQNAPLCEPLNKVLLKEEREISFPQPDRKPPAQERWSAEERALLARARRQWGVIHPRDEAEAIAEMRSKALSVSA